MPVVLPIRAARRAVTRATEAAIPATEDALDNDVVSADSSIGFANWKDARISGSLVAIAVAVWAGEWAAAWDAVKAATTIATTAAAATVTTVVMSVAIEADEPQPQQNPMCTCHGAGIKLRPSSGPNS